MAEQTARFNAFVVVTDADGANHVFSPGDPIPDWARPSVGEHCISHSSAPAMPEPEPDLLAHAYGVDEFAEPQERPTMPPSSGPGSSGEAWVRYAHQLGETEPNLKWTRQRVIDLLIRKGLITE